MKIKPTENILIVIVPTATAESNKDFLTEEELQELGRIKSAQRCDEWSTWRRVVREQLGSEAAIWYNEIGAPQTKNDKGEEMKISVSHSRSHVAVLFSERRCGLDMEHCDRNFDRIREKYLAPEEMQLATDDKHKAIMWCAKEAIYKYAGRKEIDLKRDIVIKTVDMEQKELTAELCGRPLPTLSVFEFEDQIVCWLSE